MDCELREKTLPTESRIGSDLLGPDVSQELCASPKARTESLFAALSCPAVIQSGRAISETSPKRLKARQDTILNGM